MTDKSLSRNEKFKRICIMYAESIPPQMVRIAELWQSLKTQFPNSVNSDDFRREIHSISGSGGSFGFDELAQQARKLEQIILAYRSAPDDLELVNKIDDMVTLIISTAKQGSSLPLE